jgi:hypothetical protein
MSFHKDHKSILAQASRKILNAPLRPRSYTRRRTEHDVGAVQPVLIILHRAR